MASVPPVKVLTAKMLSAAAYPMLLWLIGVVLVSGAFRLGAAALAVFVVVGAAAIVTGLALGLFMGAVLGNYRWSDVTGIYDPLRRLFMTIPITVAVLVGHRLVDRLLGDLYSGFVATFVLDSLIVIAASGLIVIMVLAIAVPAFQKRELNY
jgi:hypothetical protein